MLHSHESMFIVVYIPMMLEFPWHGMDNHKPYTMYSTLAHMIWSWMGLLGVTHRQMMDGTEGRPSLLFHEPVRVAKLGATWFKLQHAFGSETWHLPSCFLNFANENGDFELHQKRRCPTSSTPSSPEPPKQPSGHSLNAAGWSHHSPLGGFSHVNQHKCGKPILSRCVFLGKSRGFQCLFTSMLESSS